METKGSDSPVSSAQAFPDQHPIQDTSTEETGSDKDDKTLEGKKKAQSSPPSESDLDDQGSEPVKDDEDSAQRKNLQAKDRPCAESESSQGISGKEEDEVPDPGEQTRDTDGRRRSRVRHPHRKRPRSPGDESPPLRRSLVTFLRSKCESIYHEVTQMRAQQAQAPLTWEQLASVSHLRSYLLHTYQTLHTMSTQAASFFPAADWMQPTPWTSTRKQGQEHNRRNRGSTSFKGEEQLGQHKSN
ncbi:protein FRG2-like-1 [Rhynchocyon petersi]